MTGDIEIDSARKSAVDQINVIIKNFETLRHWVKTGVVPKLFKGVENGASLFTHEITDYKLPGIERLRELVRIIELADSGRNHATKTNRNRQ